MMNKANPQKPFDRMDEAWDRMSSDYGERLNLSPRSECYLKLAAEAPMTNQPLNILSLGTGLGFELDSIFERIPNARVTCIDISGKMLERMMKRLSAYADRLVPVHASYVNYPIPRETYDLVLSSKTVHHLTHEVKGRLFRSIRQGIVKNGLYLELDDVCTKENMTALWQNFEQQAALEEGGRLGEWNQNITVTIEKETELLKQAGFSGVTSPWSQLNEKGYGMAVFVCHT